MNKALLVGRCITFRQDASCSDADAGHGLTIIAKQAPIGCPQIAGPAPEPWLYGFMLFGVLRGFTDGGQFSLRRQVSRCPPSCPANP